MLFLSNDRPKGTLRCRLLNVIRVLNILAILACMTSATSLLVKTASLTSTIGWFNVFDLIEKAFIILLGAVLVITELPIKKLRYYTNENWPMFGYHSGFLTFAIVLLFLGCDVLSYLTKEDVDEKHLGEDWYRLCKAAGLMAVIMGIVNVISPFFLRMRGRTSRQLRGPMDEREVIHSA